MGRKRKIHCHHTKTKLCSYCLASQGELAIALFLEENCIHFEIQKAFPETGRCHFDFYLPDFPLLIEMDGRQHFAPFRKNQRAQKRFLQRKSYDQRKDTFCLEQKIPLLRIAYTCQKKIPQILTHILSQPPEEGIFYSNESLYREK
jgi:very-short-patch-repair endonuclease